MGRVRSSTRSALTDYRPDPVGVRHPSDEPTLLTSYSPRWSDPRTSDKSWASPTQRALYGIGSESSARPQRAHPTEGASNEASNRNQSHPGQAGEDGRIHRSAAE